MVQAETGKGAVIVRTHPSIADGDALVDREALALWCKRSPRTIREHCRAVACDLHTRRSLYLFSEVQDMNATTPKRKRLAKGERLMAA